MSNRKIPGNKPNSSSIPSIASLLAFERSAYYLSYTKAAEELGRTNSAVSRSVTEIENRLGCLLFHRKGNTISLTNEGTEYLREVQKALEILHFGGKNIAHKAGKKFLNIYLTPLLAQTVLIPKLTEFKEIFPNTEINITMTRFPINWDETLPDIEIRVGHVNDDDLRFRELGTMRSVPICSTLLLQGEHPLRDVADLVYATLIEDRYRPNDWRNWLANAGYADLKPKDHIYISDPHSIFESVRKGLGVSFCPYPYVQTLDCYGDDIIMPFGHEITNDFSYSFIYRHKQQKDSKVEKFYRWFQCCFDEVVDDSPQK